MEELEALLLPFTAVRGLFFKIYALGGRKSLILFKEM